MTERNVRIHVPALTRVEGEGSLRLHIAQGEIEELALDIFEPPRYFEKFLEGRDHAEVIDTVARICGICPVAYQMSAAQALEHAFGIDPGPWARAMRRVFYCGEWLQSHALHIHLLAAPDFLGFDSVVGMAEQYPDEVRRGLRLQGLGNTLIRLLGARSVHPVGACVGGFHRAPTPAEVDEMLAALRAGLEDAVALLRWAASLDVPDDHQTFTSVSLRHATDYPLAEGRIVSDRGLDIDCGDYERHFREEHRPQSTALFALLDDEPYLVGPLARLNLNFDRLPETTRRLVDATGVRFPSDNMFHSLLARAIEIHIAVVEAIRLLERYQAPDSPQVAVSPRAGVGIGATEAPRGLLWHRYAFDGNGIVRSARIVPPTSQNQARIEVDLRRSLLALGLDRDDADLRLRAETVIRNYDPCISCATHFLSLSVERR
ncbi:MAG: Ni/Fe hydrogenase subunit alpha [Gammaproteobacteria bacterium]|nr:Ni/Fe hydrogenase subunit alpha [Gammaproteobacteria bacterium]MCB1922271.1 Ni/Fe hydrogenase subunit alpha [Gammaproteobacteria bacterium]